MREAKDNLDGALQRILNNKAVSNPLSWYVQADGLSANLGSIHLAEQGLYLALLQGNAGFPRSLPSLLGFKESVALLVSMIFDLERNALMIRKSIDLIDDRQKTGIGYRR